MCPDRVVWARRQILLNSEVDEAVARWGDAALSFGYRGRWRQRVGHAWAN